MDVVHVTGNVSHSLSYLYIEYMFLMYGTNFPPIELC